eukprot:357690-Chlamydomonas_euryale.AAC.3
MCAQDVPVASRLPHQAAETIRLNSASLHARRTWWTRSCRRPRFGSALARTNGATAAPLPAAACSSTCLSSCLPALASSARSEASPASAALRPTEPRCSTLRPPGRLLDRPPPARSSLLVRRRSGGGGGADRASFWCLKAALQA